MITCYVHILGFVFLYMFQVLFELKLHRQSFKTFLETLEKKPVCKNMSLEELLTTPLNRVSLRSIRVIILCMYVYC